MAIKKAHVKALIEDIAYDRYIAIQVKLNNLLPKPTWREQCCMESYLTKYVIGAHFSYTAADQWTYEEEGA